MKKVLSVASLSIIILTIIVSCSPNKNNADNFKTSDSGIKYKVYYRGADTTKALESEVVTINLVYRLGDSVIFNSNTIGEPMTFPITVPLFKGDLYDALKLMGTGDSMTFVTVADSFYLKTAKLPSLPRSIKSGTPFYYDVKLLKHISNDQYKLETKKSNLQDEKKELAILRDYLKTNNITVKPTKSGLYKIPIKKGRGVTPKKGDMCQVYLSVKQLDGEELYNNFDDRAIDVEYGKEFDTKGFMEGLGTLKIGEVAEFIVPSKIGVGSKGINTVPPFTTIIYKIKLADIRTLDEVKKDREQYEKQQEIEKQKLKLEEPKKIVDYLKKNNIDIKPLSSGLYLKKLKEGSGKLPEDGNTVTVQYIHYDLDGNIIQSSYKDNTPFTYVVGSGAVIPGWEEAVKTIKKGGKSWMLIPSKIGWGEQQPTKDILPFSPLVFVIEVVDIK